MGLNGERQLTNAWISWAKRIWLLTSLILTAISGIEQAAADEINFTDWATTSCISNAPAGHAQLDCIGKSAQACMQTSRHGETTAGMMACYDAERAYWDGRLNMAYHVLISQHRSSDREMQELGSVAPSVAETLQAMQRTWIAWRDASCRYERAIWLGGTGGGPAAAACLMMLTARQAVALEDWRRDE